jgi:L-ascorbate metabolism protein UlaG (beta-lactamase superfamily)
MKKTRYILGIAAAACAGVGAIVVAGCCTFSAPGYGGPVSEHFDGEVFVNQVEVEPKGMSDMLRWRMTSEPGPWPDFVDNQPGPAPPERVGDGQLRVTWINHATALIQMDEVNVLTDPIWSKRPSPVGGIGPKRRIAPGLRFEDLPPIDAVVISHNHYDHLDLPTLERLADEHQPRFLVPLGNARLLEDSGISKVRDLDWWQRVPVADGVRLHLVPAQHWSGRGLCDRRETLWGGWVIEGPSGPVYYAGDTGWGPHFEQVRQEFGAPRLAILPIGAYKPRWFMRSMHISPAEAVRAHELLGAQASLAVHYNTFELGDDGYGEPVDALRAALADSEHSDERDVWVLEPGHGRDVPQRPGSSN